MTSGRNPQRPETRGGFILIGRATCEYCREDELPGDNTMDPVYRCPSCGQTFCDRCTDLEAWMEDHRKNCPHCGHSPGGAR